MYRIKSGEKSILTDCINQKGDDELSNAIRVEAWKKIEFIDNDFSLKLLMEGKEILESMNENIPSVLYWKISEKMFENEDFEKSINMIEDLSITDNNRLLFSLEVISKHYSEKLERTILDYMQDADEESVVFAMRCVDAPANIQLEASKILFKYRFNQIY